MNLLSLLDNELLHGIGWALLHSLWQGAIIGIAYAALGKTLRRRSPQTRYLAGCSALALLAAAPILTSLFHLDTHAGNTYPGGPTLLSALHAGSPLTAELEAHPASTLPRWLFAAAEQLSELTPWLALGWVLGVIIFGVRFARGLWWLRTLQNRGHEPVQVEWLRALNRLRVRFEISRPVRLVKSALVEVPAVIGWLRTVILLPASSIAGLTPSQLETILAHELAHVRRYDYVVNAAQCLLETLMFYHPAVWWISARVREERELCCDDLAVTICGNKLAYARALATLEQLRTAAPELACAINGGTLLNRIRRLVGASQETAISATRQAGALALIGAGLLFVVVGVLLHLGVPRYHAIARIKLDPGEASNRMAANTPRYDPYYLQTQFEIIQSEPVIRKAIDETGVAKRWTVSHRTQLTDRESVELFRSMLTIRPIRNTSIVDIKAVSTDPAEARDIANGIAQAYRDFSTEQRIIPRRLELQRLQQRAEEQQKKIDAAQERVDQLFTSLPGLEFGDGNLVSGSGPEGKVRALRIEAEAQLTREETLLEGLKLLPPERLPQALPTAVSDALLISLLEQNNLAEQKLLLVQKEFGAQHPEVIKAVSQRDDLLRKTQQRVDGILLGLETKVNSLKQNLERLQKQAASLQETELERIRARRPYLKAKRELEELQRGSETINANLAAALDQMTSSAGSVEIIEVAMVPIRPGSPNRPRATACILLGILLNVLGLVMLRNKPDLTLHAAPAPA